MEWRDELLYDIAAASRPDPQLDRLVYWSVHSEEMAVGVSITVLLSGFLVTGELAAPEQFAEHIDTSMTEGINRWVESAGTPEAGVEWREALAGGHGAVASVRRGRAWEREADEALSGFYDADDVEEAWESLSDDLKRRYLRRSTHAYFTLRDTLILGPSGPMQLPFVRIRVASVQAWWPGSTRPT